MADRAFTKIGRLMVPNGRFKDQNGTEKTRWHEIGIVLATPHHSKITIKLHANGFGEGQFATVFYDEDKKPNFADRDTMNDESSGRKSESPQAGWYPMSEPAQATASADPEVGGEEIQC